VSVYFFDSSALVKRYVREAGTIWVVGITDLTAGNQIYIARITGVEVISALTRRARSGSPSAANATAAIAQFRHDLHNNFLATDITASLIANSMQLAETHALRGYDAVQLAAALDVQAYWLALGMSGLTLVSADIALNAAAIAEGLAVDDPNAHS
jgi:predicted nucleic acid-binding protein